MTRDLLEPDEAGATMDEDDPIVEECIRDAVGPYLGVLSPEDLADHRRFLVAFIKTHPVASPLYHRLRRRPATNAWSGDMAREGAPTEDEAAARGDGTMGRRP